MYCYLTLNIYIEIVVGPVAPVVVKYLKKSVHSVRVKIFKRHGQLKWAKETQEPFQLFSCHKSMAVNSYLANQISFIKSA